MLMATRPRDLPDANVCIRVLNGTAPGTVAWRETLTEGDAAVSAISFGACMRGDILKRAGQGDRPPLEAVMSPFDRVPVVAYDRSAGTRTAKLPLRERCRIDHFSASHALSLGATLVTADCGVPKLEGLAIHPMDAFEASAWPQ